MPECSLSTHSYNTGSGDGHDRFAPIVTRVDDAKAFYPAENYHQNFATVHPANPYIEIYDAPKASALARLFPRFYRAKPELMRGGARD